MMSFLHWFQPRPQRRTLSVEIDREEDGRWIADVTELPGVLAYGTTRDEAVQKAIGLALRVLADQVEHGDPAAQSRGLSVELCIPV